MTPAGYHRTVRVTPGGTMKNRQAARNRSQRPKSVSRRLFTEATDALVKTVPPDQRQGQNRRTP